MYRFIPPVIVVAPHDYDSNVVVYALVRVLYAIVRLSSGKTMVSIFRVNLISCRYF